MEARKTARYTDKRDRILSVASDHLARVGLQGLDLAEIATTIGLRRSSLTYYFGNVEDLAAAVLERTIADLQRQVRDASGHSTLEARLYALFKAEAEVHYRWREGEGARRQHLGEIRALKAHRRHALAERYQDLMRDTVSMLTGAAHQGGEPEDHDLLAAHLVLENLFWMSAWLGFFHHWESDRVCSDVVAFLQDGILEHLPQATASLPQEPQAGEAASVSLDAYLKVATRLVCERGYRGASIDRIARELNVTKGSFYHHIAMKDDLVEVCFERSFDRLARLQRLSEQNAHSAADALALALRGVVASQMEGSFPFLRSSALVGLPSELRARVIERSQRTIRWFGSQVGIAARDGAVKAGDTMIAAQMLYIAGNSAFDIGRMLRADRAGLQERYVEMAACGIKQHFSPAVKKSS